MKLKKSIADATKLYSYEEYKSMVSEKFAKGEVTGDIQSESMLGYTKMGIQRMKKWDKVFKISETTQNLVSELSENWTWYVITEGWCGDAAQIIPVLNRISNHSDRIELKLILRDENPEIMDQYLTNGGRAIPILVPVNNSSGAQLTHWGSRPKAIKEKLESTRKENPEMAGSELSRQLHLWYAKDKGVEVQNDINQILIKMKEMEVSNFKKAV